MMSEMLDEPGRASPTLPSAINIVFVCILSIGNCPFSLPFMMYLRDPLYTLLDSSSKDLPPELTSAGLAYMVLL